ncbi:MAG: hypothetical protein K9M07_05390 [Simkaniaceae bacterium]|nr:hypothetical protein [Simkaniaceae bacterium]
MANAFPVASTSSQGLSPLRAPKEDNPPGNIGLDYLFIPSGEGSLAGKKIQELGVLDKGSLFLFLIFNLFAVIFLGCDLSPPSKALPKPCIPKVFSEASFDTNSSASSTTPSSCDSLPRERDDISQLPTEISEEPEESRKTELDRLMDKLPKGSNIVFLEKEFIPSDISKDATHIVVFNVNRENQFKIAKEIGSKMGLMCTQTPGSSDIILFIEKGKGITLSFVEDAMPSNTSEYAKKLTDSKHSVSVIHAPPPRKPRSADY